MAFNVQSAKVQMVLRHPFFSTILMRRKLQESTEIETACTDGLSITYNPDFFASLTIDQIISTLSHEVLHIAFFHHVRINGRDPLIWNYACDYAINLILKDNNMDLPKGALLDNRFKGMEAERIYDVIQKNFKPDPSAVLIGNFAKPSAKPDGEGGSVDQQVADLKSDVVEAMQTAKMRGLIPCGLDLIVEQSMKMGSDWRQRLSAFLTEQSRSDYSFRKANKRHISRGFVLPTLCSTDKGKFILAVDTSGSNTAQATLAKISEEVMSVMSLSSDGLTVVFCDSKVAHVQEIDPMNPEPLQFKGGGGTAFKPVMEWIDNNNVQPSALIYFTDLECSEFPEEPNYPVLWATDNLKLKAPYGETVYLPQLL
jgi:predicted metal-dependent peptidase